MSRTKNESAIALGQPILRLEHISKTFPGIRALNEVSFEVLKGSVHGLVGENGAGKSTLINIISGGKKPTEGEMYFEDKKCRFSSPPEAREAGICVVHQEIRLAETLSVAENIFLGHPILQHGMVDWKKMRKRAEEIIHEYDMDIDVTTPVNRLLVAQKQLVEIIHAVESQAKLLIMDEPSAVLTNRELSVLFQTVRRLKEKGVTIIYISHRLDEIMDLCDHVTILRDGEHIQTLPTNELDKEKMVSLMVGRELGQEYPKEILPIGKPIIEVENVCAGHLKDISFSVRQGEIFGISGLVGSGRSGIVRTLLGIKKRKSGTILLHGKPIHYHSFSEAIRDGFGYVPEDRKLQGLLHHMSISQNITITSLGKISCLGFIQKAKESRFAKKIIESFRIVPSNPNREVTFLSGGNQQKVVLAKWLFAESNILILDEPTRGVDVGAKTEIYRLMTDFVKEGKSIIMISSELPELLGMCDRIMVLHEGVKKGEMSREDATPEKIMKLCT